MSNTPTSNDDMQPEYEFDYSKARPNRFAKQQRQEGDLVVILEPDIAQVFQTPEQVKAVLRALIEHMPASPPKT